MSVSPRGTPCGSGERPRSPRSWPRWRVPPACAPGRCTRSRSRAWAARPSARWSRPWRLRRDPTWCGGCAERCAVSGRTAWPLTYLGVVLLIARGCVPPGPGRATAAGVAFLVAGLVVSAVAGVLRGRTMPMWREADGRLYRKGGRVTLLLWLATVAVKLGLGAVAQAAFGEPFDADALWLGLGVTLGVQQLVMAYHGRRLPAPEPGARSSAPTRGA